MHEAICLFDLLKVREFLAIFVAVRTFGVSDYDICYMFRFPDPFSVALFPWLDPY